MGRYGLAVPYTESAFRGDPEIGNNGLRCRNARQRALDAIDQVYKAEIELRPRS